MLFILTLCAILIISSLLNIKDDFDEPLFVIILIRGLSAIVLGISLLFMPLMRNDSRSTVAQLEETRKVYNFTDLRNERDRSGILVDVAEKNAKLANAKRCANSIWFNWFWTDDIRNAKPIDL